MLNLHANCLNIWEDKITSRILQVAVLVRGVIPLVSPRFSPEKNTITGRVAWFQGSCFTAPPSCPLEDDLLHGPLWLVLLPSELQNELEQLGVQAKNTAARKSLVYTFCTDSTAETQNGHSQRADKIKIHYHEHPLGIQDAARPYSVHAVRLACCVHGLSGSLTFLALLYKTYAGLVIDSISTAARGHLTELYCLHRLSCSSLTRRRETTNTYNTTKRTQKKIYIYIFQNRPTRLWNCLIKNRGLRTWLFEMQKFTKSPRLYCAKGDDHYLYQTTGARKSDILISVKQSNRANMLPAQLTLDLSRGLLQCYLSAYLRASQTRVFISQVHICVWVGMR